MKARRVDSIQNYLSPTSPLWAGVAPAQISLMPTPLAMQPTEYIRKSWENKPFGQVAKIEVASVHDGATWALRASWSGSGPGQRDFPDALAIALPVRGKPALALMGGKDAPIHYLYWRASQEGAQSLIATGIGSSHAGAEVKRSAQAAAEGDVWHVVITRALGSGKDVAPLLPGKKTGVGFAVWRGANDERAGIKAFSIDWTELMLEA